jgi:hypothetical protein
VTRNSGSEKTPASAGPPIATTVRTDGSRLALRAAGNRAVKLGAKIAQQRRPPPPPDAREGKHACFSREAARERDRERVLAEMARKVRDSEPGCASRVARNWESPRKLRAILGNI